MPPGCVPTPCHVADAPTTRRSLLTAGSLGLWAQATHATEPLPAKTRILAVALGSGSLHGHAHIGVVREFEQQGLKPDLIVGTSVGAIVGALWAAGLSSHEIEDASKQLKFLNTVAFSWSRRGLFNNKGLQNTIRTLTKNRPIETWPMRFAAVASDLASGERVVITQGDAAVAVAASAALPVVCVPVQWQGRLLADGALTEPVPARTARQLGATRVVAVDIAYAPLAAPVRNAADSAFQTMHILVKSLTAEQQHFADVSIRLELHPLMRDGKGYEPRLLEAGQAATRAAWPSIVA